MNIVHNMSNVYDRKIHLSRLFNGVTHSLLEKGIHYFESMIEEINPQSGCENKNRKCYRFLLEISAGGSKNFIVLLLQGHSGLCRRQPISGVRLKTSALFL